LCANIERDRRVCFEVDEQEGVFDYGRFECDSGLAYRSVCLFGRIRIVDDRAVKLRNSDDCDHPFRRIATSAARVQTAPLDDGGGDASRLVVGQAQ
jgi:nitroimidazol reductase NimA-like FMN-containing flavoprotein (pyridoxamine 5'-phosphate oxidase superfamily)